MRYLLIILFFFLISCKKDGCETCTQMLSQDFYPKRNGYPKTTTAKFNSCGPNNSWIGEQLIVERFIYHDTIFTKIISVDCQ